MSDERAGFLHQALFNGNGVAKRLILALVLFSSLVTAVITAVELYGDYRRDVGQIRRSIAFVGESYLPSLTNSVWVADGEQVQTQLDGLLRLPDIEYIGIVVDGRTRWSAGTVVSQRRIAEDVALVREHRGQAMTIGAVQVVASVDRVMARMWNQLLVVLVGNAVKTLLVAGFMLLVFQYLVTRHLTRIAMFVRGIDPAAPLGEQVQLERAATGRWRPDILDTVTASINGLSRSLGRAVASLRSSDQRLRALTRETTAYIYELDHDGRITFANRPHAGVTSEQVEGTLLVDGLPPALRPQIGQALASVFAQRRPQRLDYAIPDPAGQLRYFVATIRPILRDGAVASAALTAVDISEQKAAEQAILELNSGLEARVRERTAQLQQAMDRAQSANRAKSEFLSHMSHELRTPMNAILGFAQILEISDPSPRQLLWAGEIRRAGDHLLQMIEELLDLARIEAGKLAITVEPLALEAVLAEALAIVQPLIASRGVEWIDELPAASTWPVWADRLRLRQVFVNLLSNAVKYNREGGSITVRCARRGEQVRLSIIDTGMGIAADKLAKLFQPFERLGAELGSVEGTGIGLALSEQLARLMGATLGAQTTPGVGSEFWIELRHAEDAAAPSPAPTTTPGPLGELAFDVLYIEDQASNRDVIVALLAPYPQVHLRTAPSGEAGLALAREQPPDIFLLDIQLPGMDGYQILQHLRADPRLSAIPAVALSADAMPHDVQRGLAAGFDRYLTKPVDLNQLLQALSALLPRHRSLALTP